MIRRPPRSPLFPYTPLSRSRPQGARRPPVLRRAADTRRGGAGGVRGDPAQGGRALRLAPPDDRGRDVRGGAVDGLDVPVLELQGVRLRPRSEEHTSELQSLAYLVCRLLLVKKLL